MEQLDVELDSVQEGEDSPEHKEFMKDIERKRLLIKYKEENNSLRTQLRQLNERLNQVLIKQSSKVPQRLPAILPPNEQSLKRQLQNVYKSLDIAQRQAKHYRDQIKQDLHEKVKQLEDQIRQKDSENEELKKQNKNLLRLHKLPLSDAPEDQLRTKMEELNAELARLRKVLRDSDKDKAQREKEMLKKQEYCVSLQEKNRNLTNQLQGKPPLPPPAEKPSVGETNPAPSNSASAITHLEMNEQNWNFIKTQYLQLKESKSSIESKLRSQNSTLKGKIAILQKSIEVLKGRQERGPATERPNRARAVNSTIDIMEQSPQRQQPLISSFLEDNDKNYRAAPRLNQSLQAKHLAQKVPELQTLQTFQWGKPTDRKWTDSKVFKQSKEARITGVLVWYTDVIIGIRFSYRAHSKAIFTDEHVILRTKEYHKNQFEFTQNDYLQNIILHEIDGKLVGMTFVSRDNKAFEIGKQGTKSLDLGITPSYVPVYAFGTLGAVVDINKVERHSVVTSLGLQALAL